MDDLRAAAQAATPGPWKRFDTQAWNLIEDANGANVLACYNGKEDAAYLELASPDRILALCDELERPRWHHDRSLSPEDRQYCDDCDLLIQDNGRLRAALKGVLDEFDYWASEPRPAVDGGTVRLHNFTEVQPAMERKLAAGRAALEGNPTG